MMNSYTLATTPELLSVGQFNLVYNAFSLTIAAMVAAALFFFNSKQLVGNRYRVAVIISGVIVSIAAYHYFRIFNSWEAAYLLEEGSYIASGEAFNDAYRYVDWLLTVPLLLIEAVAVLGLPNKESRPLFIKLAVAAVLMIATGYPGEIADTIKERAIWGAVSTVPFAYILFVLWFELKGAIARQTERVQTLISGMRWLLLASWGVYPIAYLLPEVGITGATATVGIQIGYTVADLLAKPIFGLLAFSIARMKSQAEAESSIPESSVSEAKARA
ncbi:MAG: bacteriorhodopsin-like [Halothece sp.]